MKPAQTPQAAPEAPVRVEFQVKFTGGPKGRRQARVTQATEPPDQESQVASSTSHAAEPLKSVPPSQIPKITRLLVLGHHFENLVRKGVVQDYAEIARLTGLTRARVTQIANLTMLSPEIQEALLNVPMTRNSQEPPNERELRMVLAHAEWMEQQRAIA